MALTSTDNLAIAELVFWVPAFFISVFLCTRHGFARQSAWLFIAILGLCRIISASCLLAYDTESYPSKSLITCAAITGSLGISFMLSALVGIQVRVFENTGANTGSRRSGISAYMVRVLYLVITIGIVLSIVAGVKISHAQATGSLLLGYKLLKAASVLYLLVWVALLVLLAYTWPKLSTVPSGDKTLVKASALCMPFVLVRLIYLLISAFHRDSTFNLFAPDVWTQAFMQVMEEFVVAIIIITVGFFIPPQPKKTQAKGTTV